MTTAASPASTSWVGSIKPEWLTSVLRAAALIDGEVSRCDAQSLEVASAAGELARLSLTYGAGDGPATLIAKGRGTGATQQAMDSAMGLFARERFVYSELADGLPVRLPRCYFAGAEDRREPMLLEDLRGLRMGDQVAGLDLADAERLVDVLAVMHATFWEADPPGGDASRLVSWTDPMLGAMVTQLVTSGVGALRSQYADRVPDRVLAAIEEVAPCWSDVLARCAEGPQTFVHNDFRLDNIFFRDDGEPVVIDWQLAGRCRGTQDLAYLLSGSMATDLLRVHLDDLVSRYHSQLVAAGVREYGLEQCRLHYRQSVLYTLAPGIAMLGQMQLEGGDARGLADTFVLRTLTHAGDVDAFATL
jgi:hypothetical protein